MCTTLCLACQFFYYLRLIFFIISLTGILRYKVDLQSIQMMMSDDYYDDEYFDLDDY